MGLTRRQKYCFFLYLQYFARKYFWVYTLFYCIYSVYQWFMFEYFLWKKLRLFFAQPIISPLVHCIIRHSLRYFDIQAWSFTRVNSLRLQSQCLAITAFCKAPQKDKFYLRRVGIKRGGYVEKIFDIAPPSELSNQWKRVGQSMSILTQVYYFAFGKLLGLKLKEWRWMNLRSSESIDGYHDLTTVMSCNADNAR